MSRLTMLVASFLVALPAITKAEGTIVPARSGPAGIAIAASA